MIVTVNGTVTHDGLVNAPHTPDVGCGVIPNWVQRNDPAVNLGTTNSIQIHNTCTLAPWNEYWIGVDWIELHLPLSEPEHQLCTSPTTTMTEASGEVVLRQELSGYPCYGQQDDAADILYSGGVCTWTFRCPRRSTSRGIGTHISARPSSWITATTPIRAIHDKRGCKRKPDLQRIRRRPQGSRRLRPFRQLGAEVRRGRKSGENELDPDTQHLHLQPVE